MLKTIICQEVAIAVLKYPDKTPLQALKEHRGLGGGWARFGYYLDMHSKHIKVGHRKSDKEIKMTLSQAVKLWENSPKLEGQQLSLF